MPKAKYLKADLKKIIKDKPIVLHRWVLTSPLGGRNAWSWQGSWLGRIDDVGRGTWQTLMATSGQVSLTVQVITIPYEGYDPPKPDDEIRLYYTTGTILPDKWRVVNVKTYADESGVKWKHELIVETLQ